MADARDSKSRGAIRAGSSPATGIKRIGSFPYGTDPILFSLILLFTETVHIKASVKNPL